MESHRVLFKQDTTGAMRQWSMEQQDENYRTVTGQVAGTLVVSEWTKATVKNVGASNEKSPFVQAQLEIIAAYKKKIKEGYRETHEEASLGDRGFFEPMLAKKYEDYCQAETPWLWNKDGGGVFAQPKLDGIRCIVKDGKLQTRKGEPIPSCDHILKALGTIPYGVVLDGELYNHDLKDNFNEIASLVRKTKGFDKHLEAISNTIQYWIYDVFFDCAPDMKFSDRNAHLLILLSKLNPGPSIKIVHTNRIDSQKELDDHYEMVLSWGMEGQIVRLDAPYENKRTKSLLKRKEFQDEEFIIQDVLEGIGNRSGMAGSLLLQLGDGRTFQSGIKGGRDHYRYLLAKRDQFIGKKTTIRYFHRTPDGIPRFPVSVDIDRKD